MKQYSVEYTPESRELGFINISDAKCITKQLPDFAPLTMA